VTDIRDTLSPAASLDNGTMSERDFVRCMAMAGTLDPEFCKARPINGQRSRRKALQMEAIRWAIMEILTDDHPMTVRQVF
jgi:hypothetical protein